MQSELDAIIKNKMDKEKMNKKLINKIFELKSVNRKIKDENVGIEQLLEKLSQLEAARSTEVLVEETVVWTDLRSNLQNVSLFASHKVCMTITIELQ